MRGRFVEVGPAGLTVAGWLSLVAHTVSSPVPCQTPSSDALPSVPWGRVEGFLGQLTHDIRNGLNAVELQLTFLGEISTEPEVVDEIKQLRNTLANVTRQLQALRTATGAVTPYALAYPAEDFFEDLQERFARLDPAAGGGVTWESTLANGTMLTVDPDQTINALLELLVNARHFAGARPEPIRVEVSAQNDAVAFVLREPQTTPPAVPPRDWGRTPLLTTRRGAYGLGLFRVRRCLESQGGTLDVDFSPEAGLLTTTATLPGAAPVTP